MKKGHKPAANHPWKKMVPSKVVDWAKEQSDPVYPNAWKVGGGHKPWNGGNEKK